MSLAENLAKIQKQIVDACERANRPSEEVSLVAVSKGHGPAAIREAVDDGLTLFGENKIQEAKIKIGQCPGHLSWHFIGHLQTNKCRDAVHFFKMIHGVDSMRIAQEIDKWCDRHAKSMPILLEVNVGGEANKYGFSPDELMDELAALNALPRLEIHGLMTMAPWTPEPEKVRPVFRRLAELKTRCEDQLGAPLPHLSMGMSGDFVIAVEEGATLVRIGTALFGPRKSR